MPYLMNSLQNCASVRGGAAGPRTAFPTRWYRTQLPRESVRASQVVASAAPDQKPSLWSFFPAEEVALCNGALQWGCSGLPDLTALHFLDASSVYIRDVEIEQTQALVDDSGLGVDGADVESPQS